MRQTNKRDNQNLTVLIINETMCEIILDITVQMKHEYNYY